MNSKINHYVEETWIELDYEKGLRERNVISPIKTRESYIPLPWVKKYSFFNLNNENSKTNITPIINNKNYNPLYFMDNQNNMISSSKVDLEIVHYIKETWIEIEYFPKKVSEREIVLPIKNIEKYQPSPWVKKYSFIDYLKINIDGKVIIDKTPLNETITYTNPIFNTSHLKNKSLIDKKNKTDNHHIPKTLIKKNYVDKTRKAVSN